MEWCIFISDRSIQNSEFTNNASAYSDMDYRVPVFFKIICMVSVKDYKIKRGFSRVWVTLSLTVLCAKHSKGLATA
jgi:hypothetical protein